MFMKQGAGRENLLQMLTKSPHGGLKAQFGQVIPCNGYTTHVGLLLRPPFAALGVSLTQITKNALTGGT